MAQTTYQRGQNLFKEGVISRQRRDEMQAAAISAAQMTEAAYQQYARAKRGSTPQQQSSADAQVKIAQAALDEANALEAETQLVAPSAGTISSIISKKSVKDPSVSSPCYPCFFFDLCPRRRLGTHNDNTENYICDNIVSIRFGDGQKFKHGFHGEHGFGFFTDFLFGKWLLDFYQDFRGFSSAWALPFP